MVLLAIFIVISTVSFEFVRRVRSQVETHRAFAAIEIEKRFDATGIERYQEQRIYAVRSDGSSVWLANRLGPDGQAGTVGEIVDLANQRVISMDGFTGSTTTEQLTPSELGFRQRVNRTCQAGSQRSTILGQNVVKISQTPVPTNPSTERTEWAAPDFDCYVLSGTYVQYKNGQPGPKTTRQTTFLIPGEPAASLFEVPASYVERSPSQVAAEFARRFGHGIASQASVQQWDEKYAVRH